MITSSIFIAGYITGVVAGASVVYLFLRDFGPATTLPAATARQLRRARRAKLLVIPAALTHFEDRR